MQKASWHHPSIKFKMEPHLKNDNVYKDVRSCLLQQVQNMTPMHLPQHAHGVQFNKVSA
jgi:hypothetical protein